MPGHFFLAAALVTPSPTSGSALQVHVQRRQRAADAQVLRGRQPDEDDAGIATGAPSNVFRDTCLSTCHLPF